MTLLISLIATLLIQTVLCQNACYEESSRINFFFFVEGSDNPNANGKYEIEDYSLRGLASPGHQLAVYWLSWYKLYLKHC